MFISSVSESFLKQEKCDSLPFQFLQFPRFLVWVNGKTLSRRNKNKFVKTANMLIDPSSSSIRFERMRSAVRSSLMERT